MKKIVLNLIFVLCLCLSLIACSSKELSRSTAKSILNKNKQHVTSRMFAGAYFSKGSTEWDAFSKLQKSGYAEISGPEGFMGSYKAHFTQKIAPFIVHKERTGLGADLIDLSCGKIVIDEITGISDVPVAQGYKSVEFTGHTEINELGKILGGQSEAANSRKGSAQFKKYDDGWRLEHESFDMSR